MKAPKPKFTRSQREQRGRAFMEWLMLPLIGTAVKNAGLRGDAAVSAALGEVDRMKDLQHLTGPRGRW